MFNFALPYIVVLYIEPLSLLLDSSTTVVNLPSCCGHQRLLLAVPEVLEELLSFLAQSLIPVTDRTFILDFVILLESFGISQGRYQHP